MSKYKFETEDFGLSENGIHLLRSRFNYETILFQEIEFLRIEKSKVINNWLIVLLLGFGMVVFSVYYTFVLIDVFENGFVGKIYLEELLIPFLPFVAGVFMIFSALRNGLIMVVQYNTNKKKRIPLQTLEKKDLLDDFVKELDIRIKQAGKQVNVAAFV